MDLLGDVSHMESCFCPFGYSVSVDARLMLGFTSNLPKAQNHFRRTRWYSLVTMLKWKLDLVDLDIVLILTQDRCIVYVEPTICLEVILDTPDRTPR